MPRRAEPGSSREDENTRVTFYCPVDVLEAIEAEMARTERSKSQVIVQALIQALVSPSSSGG